MWTVRPELHLGSRNVEAPAVESPDLSADLELTEQEVDVVDA